MSEEDSTSAHALNGRDALDEVRAAGPADALARLGAAFSTPGRAQEAVSFYERALADYRASHDRRGEALTLASLAQAWWQRGEIERAVETYAEAAEVFRLVNEPAGEAAALNCLGLLHDRQGDLGAALGYYEQALAILWDAGDRDGEAATLDVIGMTLRRMGSYRAALDAHQQALAIRRQRKDQAGEASTRHALAMVFDAMGQPERAIAYYEWALRIRQSLEDRPGEAITSYNLARLYERLNLLREDEALLSRAGDLATLLQQPDRVFSQADLELLAMIGIQTEMAAENARLYEEAQRHAAQLARLNEITAVFNSTLNPERLLQLIASSAIEVAGCNRAALYLLEQDAADPGLRLAESSGFSPDHTSFTEDIARLLTDAELSAVLDEGRMVTVADVNAKGDSLPEAARLLAEREGFAAYAYLPLRVQHRPVGVLAVTYDQPHHFTDSEIELLGTFANQSALAIANARVYQQVDIQLARRVDQIVRMADISQRLSATLEMDTIFKLIVQSAIEGCNADAGVLLLTGDPEQGYAPGGEPHMVAWRGFDKASSLRAPHLIAEELATSPVLERGEARLLSAEDGREDGPPSQLAVPILLEGQVIGAIGLESEAANAFSQEDLSFVSQLAVQAAVAIRNAQLYRNAQSVRDRLHAILDASNDGLLMIDPRGRIVMTNTRMEDFWDFARQDFQTPSPDQSATDPLSGLGEGLGYRTGELAALLRRGTNNPKMKPQTDIYTTRPLPGQPQRYVERTAAPVLDDEGQFIGLLLIFRDVTEQKELEEARQNLTNMIVHELRSPLQAVMGSMRLIAEVTANEDPIVEQATDVSRRAVKKLLNLVNNLLDLSRMERGEFVLDPSFEPIGPVLDDAVQELMPLAQEMSTVVRVEVPDDLPATQIDRDMVGRVVLNLLDNALKYTEPGSLVSVQAALLPDQGAPGREVVCVSITDNGPGIPDEHKESVFDRFSQIPGRRGRRRSAGLGLAFCKMAVESHGGRIWVEDNPEGGSVFRFSLPTAPAAPDPRKPRQRSAGKASPDGDEAR